LRAGTARFCGAGAFMSAGFEKEFPEIKRFVLRTHDKQQSRANQRP